MANENNFLYLQSAWLAQTIYHSTSLNFLLIGDKKKDWQTVELGEIKWSFTHPLVSKHFSPFFPSVPTFEEADFLVFLGHQKMKTSETCSYYNISCFSFPYESVTWKEQLFA